MSKCVVKGTSTESMNNSTISLANNLTFGFCDAIVEAGGFDRFVETLDLTVLNDCDNTQWPRFKKYLAEKNYL